MSEKNFLIPALRGVIWSIVGFAVALATLLIGAPLRSASAEHQYTFVNDQFGRTLGLIWQKDGAQKSGELAIHKQRRTLLFISCDRRNIRDNEAYMRRTERNCAGLFAIWPTNLIYYVTVALSQRVVLTGPPDSCGTCMPRPYVEFDLPANVIIDSGQLQRIEREQPNVIRRPPRMPPGPGIPGRPPPGIPGGPPPGIPGGPPPGGFGGGGFGGPGG